MSKGMDQYKILNLLANDIPLFHELSEDGVKRLSGLGYDLKAGPFSMSVPPAVLQWIADHIKEGTETLETGAGYTTVLLAALSRHHYCLTSNNREIPKIADYLSKIGIPESKVTFILGSSDKTLPTLKVDRPLGFSYIDGCHGYPFPALEMRIKRKATKVIKPYLF